MPTETMMEQKTYNLHIAGIARYVSRYTEEISKSVSAGVTALTSADKRRLLAYVSDLRAYVNWVWSLQTDDNGGVLDLPEVTPKETLVPMPDPVARMENNALIDVVEYFKAFYTESMSSQSSRLGGGFLGHDYNRWIALLDTIDSYIAEFVSDTAPQDFPESSPSAQMPLPGKTGV